MSNLCASPSCEYPTGQDAFVCKICVQQLSRDLGDVPALIDDLHITLSRQDVLGAGSGRRAAETGLPWKDAASEALWVLINTVLSWTRELQDPDAAPFPDAPIKAARWLLNNARHASTHPDAGKLVDEIAAAVGQAYTVIDRPPDLLLAGQCGVDGCEEYLYARPDAQATTCRACEHLHQVEERRALLMAYASEMQLPASLCLSWIKLLMGKTIPRGTWDRWVHYGRNPQEGRRGVGAAAVDHSGNPLYRFGDVRDMAADWVARPRKDKVA